MRHYIVSIIRSVMWLLHQREEQILQERNTCIREVARRSRSQYGRAVGGWSRAR